MEVSVVVRGSTGLFLLCYVPPPPPRLDPLPSHLCSTSSLSCQLRPPCPLFPELPTQPSLSKLQAPKVFRGDLPRAVAPLPEPRVAALRAFLRREHGAGAGPGQGVRWRSEIPPGSPSRRAVRPGSAARFVLDPVRSPRPTKLPDCASAPLGPGAFLASRLAEAWEKRTWPSPGSSPAGQRGPLRSPPEQKALSPGGAPGRPRGPWSWSPQSPDVNPPTWLLYRLLIQKKVCQKYFS